MGVSVPASGFIAVEHGTIEFVDTRNYTCRVRTEASRVPEMVPVPGPYQHPKHGGGIHIMPECGAEVELGRSQDGTLTILSYKNAPSQGQALVKGDDGTFTYVDAAVIGYGDNRPAMEEGDIIINTRDGNSIKVLRGGLIQVSAGPLAQMMLIPVDNIVRFFFQRLQLLSPVGEVDWGHVTLQHATSENPSDTTKETPCLFRWSTKETAQEDISKGYTVEVRAGRLQEGTLDTKKDGEHLFRAADIDHKRIETGITDNTTAADKGIVSVVCYSHETSKSVFVFQINRDGHVFFRLGGNLHIEVDKAIFLYAKNAIRLQVQTALIDILKDLITVDAKTGAIVLKAANISLEATTSLKLSCAGASLELGAGKSTFGGLVLLGGAVSPGTVATVEAVNKALVGIPVLAAPGPGGQLGVTKPNMPILPIGPAKL